MSNAMIARVEKAIREADAAGYSPARAAIAAMREPTEEMMDPEALRDTEWILNNGLMVWQAMIDEALKE
jgi:hypothetical protein